MDDEDHTLAKITTEGTERLWMALYDEVKKHPFARAMMAASFASPLIEKLKQRIIYYHCWGNSKSGKTASLLFAMSIWGDPKALTKTYASTVVGMEHRAAMMRHLPLALDEIQNRDKKVNLGNLVYSLGNGVGKVRGKASGGNRATETWNNCILSTGEEPISTNNTMDGINTRLFEIKAEPIEDPVLGKAIHQIAISNYGFAGPKYIKFLINEVLTAPDAAKDTAKDVSVPVKPELPQDQKRPAWMLIAEESEQKGTATRMVNDFRTVCAALAVLFDDSDPQFDNIAVLALADYYASLAVSGLSEEKALEEAVALGGILLENQRKVERRDVIDRAWDYTCSWIARNRNKFESEAISPAETYGVIKDGKCYVLASVLNSALKEAEFSETKSTRGFADRGYIEVVNESNGRQRTQALMRINGISSRVYVLNLPK